METLEKAKPYFNIIAQLLRSHSGNGFLEHEKQFYTNAIILHTNNINAGLYELSNKEQLKMNSGWSPIPIRHGINSIKGLAAECMLQAEYNFGGNAKGQARLLAENKETQVKGIDVILSHPDWEQSYTGQVKSIEISTDNEITMYADWLTYSLNKVDRLLLVDIFQRICISMDYAGILSNLSHKFAKDSKITISLKTLEKHKSLYFKYLI